MVCSLHIVKPDGRPGAPDRHQSPATATPRPDTTDQARPGSLRRLPGWQFALGGNVSRLSRPEHSRNPPVADPGAQADILPPISGTCGRPPRTTQHARCEHTQSLPGISQRKAIPALFITCTLSHYIPSPSFFLLLSHLPQPQFRKIDHVETPSRQSRNLRLSAPHHDCGSVSPRSSPSLTLAYRLRAHLAG